jgi:hypothetical protein
MQLWTRMHTASRHALLDRRISMAVRSLTMTMIAVTWHTEVLKSLT